MIEQEIIKDIKETENVNIAKNMFILNGYTKETVSNIIQSKDEKYEDLSLCYLRNIDFKNLDLVEAYRKLATFLFINGDSQNVDMVHRRFSKIYFEDNPHSFSAGECHSIITAFIMLNSDLHSKNVTNKMTLEQFIDNIEKAFPEYHFDHDVLKSIYKAVKQKQIKHTHDHVKVMRKRSNEGLIDGVTEMKKTKSETENIRNFGFQVVKMKTTRNSAFQIFENKKWKPYFSSVNDLKLSLYKHDEFRDYYENEVKKSPGMKIVFREVCWKFIGTSEPVEELPLYHALAVPLVSDNRKCELLLIDNSKYVFKIKEAQYAENWAYSINLAASSLSKPPLWTVQNNNHAKMIIQQKWSLEISKLCFKEQREKTEQQMKKFESDLLYLKENPSKKSDYKSNLKYVTKHFERYKVYNRTLDMSKCDFLQIIQNPHAHNNDQDSSNLFCTWSSTNNLESSTSSVFIESSSRKPSNISSIESEEEDESQNLIP